MTNRDLTIRGLKACGWRIDETFGSKKYLVFTRQDDPRTYFVGRSGALRMSPTGNVTTSLSLTGSASHRAYQAVGDPAYRFESVEQAREVWSRVSNLPQHPLCK